MAAIPGFRFDITGASGSQGLLSPKSAWRAYIFPRGGYASADSTGTLITFDSAVIAARFTAGNWLQVGLSTANIRQVAAVGGNSLSVSGSAVTVAENDRVYLIGNTQPTVSGGSATYTTPNTIIRQRDDDGADLYTNSMITSNSNGLIQGFASPGIFDCIIQDGNQANQGSIIDFAVDATAAGFAVTTDLVVHGAAGVTGTLTAGSTLTVVGRAAFGSTATFTQGVSIGQALSVAYNTVSPVAGTACAALRVGGRAQTTGDNRTLGYFSELYDQPILDTGGVGETAAVYGINLYTNSVASGAECFALQGDIQFNPTAAVTHAGGIYAVQGGARYAGSHASAVLSVAEGGHFQIRTGTGATGTVTQAHGVAIVTPINAGTVAFGQYIGLFVQGASSGFATQNQIANFTGGDNDSTFLVRGSPLRIDDSANTGNNANPGRAIDIFRTIVGNSATTTAYFPVHLLVDLKGTFTAGDDVYGYRSLVRTNTASGDGTNLDIVAGYLSNMDHRSDATIDELYGHDFQMAHSTGSGIINTSAGFRSFTTHTAGQTTTNLLGGIITISGATPSAAHGNYGHLLLTPVSVAAPATALAALTGAANGTLVFLTDSDNADNSGLYLRMNGAWFGWTPGGVAAASDT